MDGNVYVAEIRREVWEGDEVEKETVFLEGGIFARY